MGNKHRVKEGRRWKYESDKVNEERARGMIIGQTNERNGKGLWEKRGKEIKV